LIWNVVYRWMFSELERFETLDDRRQVIERVKDAVGKRESYIGLLLLFTLGFFAVDWAVRKPFGLPDWLVPIKPGIAMVISGFVALYLMRRRLRPVLWQFMNERAMPTCMKCGYDLRGQVDRRCPECGTAF